MENFDIYKSISKVHIIGMGGISTSGLAKLFVSFGKVVSGSDKNHNPLLSELNNLGVKTYIGHRASNIKSDVDLVIYSLAIKDDNPELKKAKKLGIKCIKRGEALGLIAKHFENVIAISGMHGKTTTTAMIYHIFRFCGQNPTLHIGGEIDEKNKNLVIGDDKFFITEACEYGDSFLSLYNAVSVINNIEKEHLDYFKSLKNIYKSFNQFMLQSKICFVNSNLKQKLITLPNNYVGKGGAVFAENIKKSGSGYSFDVYILEQFYGRVSLKIAGKYNIHNALSAIAVANYYNLDKEKVIKALNTFQNVKMRFEYIGKYNGKKIIFDYAHHPTEIKQAITAAKGLKMGKVFVYFQPHTYSRTKSLKKEFSNCFKGADSVFVVNTYKARETEDKQNNEKALALLVEEKMNKKVDYGDINKLIADIKARKDNGILLFVGAGDMQMQVKKVLFGAKQPAK